MSVADHDITAIAVDHVVPTLAFLIQSQNRSLLHLGDTGPTKKVWSFAHRHETLNALVIEASFPNRLQAVADASCHLTPRTLGRELDKLAMKSPRIWVTHLKPEFRREIIRDLNKLKNRRLRVLEDGEVLRL
jgi:ribonuclease BN (tRNA processing enzyme)